MKWAYEDVKHEYETRGKYKRRRVEDKVWDRWDENAREKSKRDRRNEKEYYSMLGRKRIDCRV